MKIDDNVPIPKQWDIESKKYNTINLEIGQSVFHECNSLEKRKRRGVVLNAAISLAKYHGLHRKFVTRSLPGGFRIWRVE